MFRWIRNFREALRRRRGSVISARWREVFECEHGPLPASKGPGAYQRNMEFFRSVCEPSHDMVFRELICCGQRAALIFADGANNKQLLEQDVVAPLLTASGEKLEPSQVLHAAEVKPCEDLKDALEQLMGGDVLLLSENAPGLWVLGMRLPPTRSVGESQRDAPVYGPRESFTESMRLNTALLRRRVRDPNLVMEMVAVGRRSRTGTVVCYIRGLADAAIVEQVTGRLRGVDIDLLGDVGQLEQYLAGDILTPFPQIENTERPDAAAQALCDGRVVILCDGSPAALLAPVTFGRLLIPPDDRYKRWTISTLERLVRWAALVIACIAPALYVAVVSFHPGIMPARMELVSAANRMNIPFSAAMEVFLLEMAIELLREASVRMPRSISSTLGIVGGIIIGDAAIKAGLINPLAVVVVGVTAICSFALPSYALAGAFRVVKLFILLSTCFLGLVGFSLAVMLVLGHLCMLDSCGVNYMQGSGRLLWQIPLPWDRKRPEDYRALDPIRQKGEK